MSTRAKRNGAESVPAPREFESLYLRLVKLFYEKDDRKRTQKIASRLERVLAASPDYSGSIRGEEVRSLIAEFRGDFAEAVRSREAEIRKILELHTLTANSENWKSVSRHYDFSDVSDRLDLLAILYDTQGQLDRAISTLLESRHYCQSHRIPFDAQDLLEELEQARTGATDRTQTGAISQELLDKKIREVYREFGASADEIVVDDGMSRRFTEAVNRALSGTHAVTVKEVKRRLLNLRRRGEARGGLPRRKPH
jgi:hypothetical protein